MIKIVSCYIINKYNLHKLFNKYLNAFINNNFYLIRIELD